MHISVFGTGYVGLVAGACLADVGHQVTCMDVNAERIAQLNAGDVPIFEPGLSTIVTHNVAAGRLRFTTDAAQAVAEGELLFIAVGTPPDEDGSADLRYVLEVARTIGQHMDSYKLVIDKSTVPVGTAEKVHAAISEVLEQHGVSHAFDVCSNPEFMKEGAAIEDFTRGARIIVGTESERVKARMQECYAPYNRNHEKLMFMSVRAAELTKYAANAMLATKISFMNEIANLAERLEVDIEDVRRGIGSDPRIGYHFIYPGCGYGGSCFPKDVQALERAARQLGYTPELLSAVEAVNLRQKQTLFTKLQDNLGSLSGKTIAVWGLAFKPNTDDMREAPSRSLMEALWQAGAKVQAFDPEAMAECRRIYGERDDLMLAGDRIQAVKGADALVICTEWKEFRSVDFAWLAQQLADNVVIDGRNLYTPDAVEEAGLRYIGVGRRSRG
ncbi:UDP-glucose dehydrogenase family protein [Vreelandella maris]|uniref:UDP-glucose 6-dehydrogenase n=1 Tax=Vreelandella maris TaxID=2729617 RepID=A0A7Y6VA61_9GAMM|nr:UDP-glucose/GDP-mannose dehydrogenase family protein [Halomonas maris]NVF16288.1 UDP-glucose/GDP-mannose dehydrogenase family protein [Halomonas maris]|tara:strand:+ start:206 stop:1534 length:1329 start_codon:yes stop_codon:yes gene_type:complete